MHNAECNPMHNAELAALKLKQVTMLNIMATQQANLPQRLCGYAALGSPAEIAEALRATQ